MKKVLISFLLVFGFAIFSVSAQCGETVRKKALEEMGDSQYIKDYPVELIKNNGELNSGLVKFNVILNSRNHYRFNVVNGGSNASPIIMQLYDKDKLEASNFDGGKMYKAFEYVCRTTKVYQLVFSFPGGEEGCAEAVLSLVKQYSSGEMGF
jgi:hypothetical protein